MTKNIYMTLLKEGLKSVDEGFAREIESDCEMHFTNGQAQGKGEDELCRELGDVNELIRDCLEMSRMERIAEYVPVTGDVTADGAEADADLDREGEAEAADGEGSEAQSEAPAPVYSIARRLDDDPVYHNVSVICDNFESNVVPSTDGCIHIQLVGNNDGYYDLEESYDRENNTYRVRVRRKKSFIYFFGIGGLWVKLNIAIPEGLESFSLKSTNGKISMGDIRAGRIELKTTNGAVSMHNLQAQEIISSSQNGAVKASKSEAYTMEIVTTNGSVNADEVYFERGNFRSQNGRVRVKLDSHDRDYVAQVTTRVGHTSVKGAVDIFDMQTQGISMDDCIQVRASTICGSVDIFKV